MIHFQSFWRHLPRPFFVLAPMEDVTDSVFRQVIIACGRPDVMMTEFTSVEGLSSTEGHDRVVHRLQYSPIEKPLVAQIWGITPEHYESAARLARERGFDGLDINMGCPVKKVVRQGACSALIKNPNLAADIIEAAKLGAAGLPVSVKTRIGFREIQTIEWIGHLLAQDLDVITIHARTVKDLSKVPARWEEIGRSVLLRNEMRKDTLIIGNGDVVSRSQGLELGAQYGVDGIMIGRGVFQNPWVFNPDVNPEQISQEMKLNMLLYHLRLFQDTWGDTKHFAIMKKFLKVYIAGFAGASDLRSKLMKSDTCEDMIDRLQHIMIKKI